VAKPFMVDGAGIPDWIDAELGKQKSPYRRSEICPLSFAKIQIFSKHWTSFFTLDTVGLMIHALLAVVSILASAFRHRQGLALENLALRQQPAVYQRRHSRPRLRPQDRLFWVWLSKVWSQWRSALSIVKPETVLRWHREGFKLFWTRLSRRKDSGRPPVNAQVKALIKQMAQANPLWEAPRIHGELLKLGIDISERTVSQLMPKNRKPPSQTWRTFLDNYFLGLVSIDFLTVPTATFRVLYVFIVLAHDRRQVLHFNVTEHPTAAWTAQQIIETFTDETAPRYLLRDHDQIYGEEFRLRVARMKIEEVITAARSPWQNTYVERLIGSIRRECLDHVIVLGENHLRRILRSYIAYYNNSRPHRSLDQNSPLPRTVESGKKGPIISIPEVGGLHHRYQRAA
jgi:putative transposase